MADKGVITKKKAWVLVLVSLVDDVIILALIVAAILYFKIRLPVWAFVLLGLGLGSFIFVRTWAVLPSLRRRKMHGPEGMIGLVGEVVNAETPEMTVRVSGEYWQAESAEGDFEAGEEVEIVSVNRLKLEVKRKVS